MDTVARYGGEEFVILLPETSLDGALEVAHKLQRTVESTGAEGEIDGPAGSMTISIGVASVQDGKTPPEQLLLHADEALYRAKANGRNRVEAAR